MNLHQKLLVITLTLLIFAMGTSEFIVIGLLNNIATNLHVSVGLAGILVSIFAIAYAIGTPLFTAICVNINKFKIVVVFTVLFIISNIASALSNDFTTLMIVRMFTAVVCGVLISHAMVVADMVIPKEHKAFTIALIFSGFAVANVIGVPLGTWIGQWGGWRLTFWLNAILGAILLVLQFITIPRNLKTHSSSIFAQFSILKNFDILITILIPFFGMAATFTVYTYISNILTEGMGIPLNQVSLALFIFGVFAIFSNYISGRIARHDGLSKLPAVFILLAIVFIILFFTMNSLILGSITLLALALLIYAMNTTIQLKFMSYSLKYGGHNQGFLASLTPVSINLGISFGAYSGSLILQYMHMQYLTVFACIYALLAGVCSSIAKRAGV